MKLDYKFFTLFLSILGVTLTIWFANTPSSEKSLSINVLSKGLLNILDGSEIKGLKILIDESEMLAPALTILTIKNNGSSPIRSDDFESDIEIIFEGTTKLIRASIIKTQPEGLKASISVKGSKAYLAPILLNPDDSVTINMLSEGLPETVSTRSRIAGIKDIKTGEPEGKKESQKRSYIRLAAAFTVAIALTAIYDIAIAAIFGSILSIPTYSTEISKPVWILVILTLITSTQTLMFAANEVLFGFKEFWQQLLSFFAMIVLAWPCGSFLNRVGSKPNTADEKT